MTVSSVVSRWEYTGNASTTNFAYTNKIFSDADLEVYLDGVLQTLTTHYAVSGAGAPSGGNVIFLTAPGAGVTVLLVRSVARTQEIDYVENDPFPAETTEDGLDRAMIVAQEQDTALARRLGIADTDDFGTGGDLEIPVLATRKGAVLGFNATTGDPEAVAVSSFGALPAPGDLMALNMIRVNAAGTAYEEQTPTQVAANVMQFAPDGTVGAPGISFASAPTTGWYMNGTEPRFAKGGVELLRFTTAGMRGNEIEGADWDFTWHGDTVTNLFHIDAAADKVTFGGTLDLNSQKIAFDADEDTYFQSTSDDNLHVYLAGAQDFGFAANLFYTSVDSRIVMGHTASLPGQGAQQRILQLHGTNDVKSGMNLTRWEAGTAGPSINFTHSRSGTIGTPGTPVTALDILGAITFGGDDGTDNNNATAEIYGIVDDTVSSNTIPTALVFETGTTTGLQRMRINSDGTLWFGPDVSSLNTAADTLADDFVFQGQGLSVLAEGGADAYLMLGNNNDVDAFNIRAQVGGSGAWIKYGAANVAKVEASKFSINGANANIDFVVGADANTYSLFHDASAGGGLGAWKFGEDSASFNRSDTVVEIHGDPNDADHEINLSLVSEQTVQVAHATNAPVDSQLMLMNWGDNATASGQLRGALVSTVSTSSVVIAKSSYGTLSIITWQKSGGSDIGGGLFFSGFGGLGDGWIYGPVTMNGSPDTITVSAGSGGKISASFSANTYNVTCLQLHSSTTGA